MLEYTTVGNSRPSLGMLVHHTDADREYAARRSTKVASPAPARAGSTVGCGRGRVIRWPAAAGRVFSTPTGRHASCTAAKLEQPRADTGEKLAARRRRPI